MSMRASLFSLVRGALPDRESAARRIGEILSILFLISLGTVATLTSMPTRGPGPADAHTAITAPPSGTAR
jgi:hypothetical protein